MYIPCAHPHTSVPASIASRSELSKESETGTCALCRELGTARKREGFVFGLSWGLGLRCSCLLRSCFAMCYLFFCKGCAGGGGCLDAVHRTSGVFRHPRTSSCAVFQKLANSPETPLLFVLKRFRFEVEGLRDKCFPGCEDMYCRSKTSLDPKR